MRDLMVDVWNPLLDFLGPQTQGRHAALKIQVSDIKIRLQWACTNQLITNRCTDIGMLEAKRRNLQTVNSSHARRICGEQHLGPEHSRV